MQDYEEGTWDWSTGDPRWVQPHESLLQDALHSWKGDPVDMRLHMQHERAGEPQPSSGGGKKMRAQAAALIREMETNARLNPQALYRGSHREPQGYQAYSESRAVANTWAKRHNKYRQTQGAHGYDVAEPATTRVARKGTVRGIRISDYAGHGGLDQVEREWIIDHHMGDQFQ